MTYLYIVWLFFSAFFFYFAYINWRQSTEGIRPFKFRERSSHSGKEETDPELDKANINFINDFNAYLESVNKHNSSRQRAAAIGFSIAGVISLASLFILLFG